MIINYCTFRIPDEPEDITVAQQEVPADDKGLFSITMKLRKMHISNKSIKSIKELIPKATQFRIRECPLKTTKCCGDCTHICNARCVQDAYTKIQLLASTHPDSPLYNEKLVKLAQIALDPENHYTYVKLLALVNMLLKDRSYRHEGLTRSQYAMNYAQHVILDTSHDKKTTSDKARAKVNIFTGEIEVVRYPDSGLCLYCMPIVSRVNMYIAE